MQNGMERWSDRYSWPLPPSPMNSHPGETPFRTGAPWFFLTLAGQLECLQKPPRREKNNN
jgi:hypothetical protein